MMSQSSRPHQFVISGFHRSGTSLTAQYLHRAGLNLGDNLLGANPSNPDGHFEDQDIVALHKDILAANHRDWFTPGPDLSSSADVFQARANALVNRFPTDRSFGFKDPRSSLLLPWWHQQLDNPAAIIVYRHYAGCLHSLRNRQAQNLVFAPSRHKDALFFWQQPALGLELWLSYNNAILDYVRAHSETTLLVSHHSMLNGFNLPAAVNQTLGLSLDTRCNSGIRQGSGQRPVIAEDIDTELQGRLDVMLAALNALCCSEPEPAGDHTVSRNVGPVKSSERTQRETIERRLDQLHISSNSNSNSNSAATGASSSPHKQAASPRPAQADNVAVSAEHSDDVRELIQWGKRNQSRQCNDAAEACWLKAHTLAPRNAAPLLHLALLARNRGNNGATIQLMQQAIQLKPDDAGFHYHLARALNDCDKPEQALDLVRHGLTLQHDHCELLHLQLDLLLSLYKPMEARDACIKALSLFPDDIRFMKSMVRLAGIDNDSSTAMIWFRRSVLTRMREDKTYRQTLLHAMAQVPSDQLPALSRRVIDELSKLNTDATPGLPCAPGKGTSLRLAMSILVRDEADVIRDNILYHAAAGVDHFIVTDNGSVDGSREVLEELRQVVELVIIDEPSHTIDQDLWVTRMAQHVRDNSSADWIINNDADEFWLSHEGSLKDAIVSDLYEASTTGTTIGTLYCHRFNLIPSLESVTQAGYRFHDNHYKVTGTLYESEQSNPWHENHSNSLIRTLPGKVISQLEGLESIDMGNHGARHQHARLESNRVSVAHYPVRSYEQFERKVVNYGQSLANNSRFAQNVSRHLRFWYEQHQLGNLYQEYQKFVLPESRLKQLIDAGIVCIEAEVASVINAGVSSRTFQPRAIAS